MGMKHDEQTADARMGRDAVAVLTELLPWGISTLLHVGVVLLSLFIVWTTARPPVGEEGPFGETRSGMQMRGEGLGLRGVQDGTIRLAGPVRTGGHVVVCPAPKGPVIKRTGWADERNLTPLIGAGGQGFNPVGALVDQSRTGATGSGLFPGAGGDGGRFPRGTPDGDGRPGGRLIGQAPARVAYVIDASGSVVDNLPFVLTELKRSLNDLREEQQFAVVFFQEGQAVEVPPGGMQAATPTRVREVLRWLDAGHVAARGMTTPLPALQRALAQKPQLMYVLSDNITGRGKYALDPETFLREVAKANTGDTRVIAIQFVYPDPAAAYGRQPTLELLAEQTGGRYRFVDERELYDR